MNDEPCRYRFIVNIMPKKRIKIILSQDVSGVGGSLDVKEVPLGYFRNYLLPNNLADIATEKKLQELEERKVKAEEKRNEKVKELEASVKKLAKITLTFKAKASDKGKIFGSITSKDIETELAEKGFSGVSTELKTPLKEAGEHMVKLNFGDGVKGKVKVVVETD